MFSKHPPFLWNKPSHLICNLSVFYYFYAINEPISVYMSILLLLATIHKYLILLEEEQGLL